MRSFLYEPAEIERKSMEIIAPYLKSFDLSVPEKKIYSRLIHASGDVSYAPLIRISTHAVAAAKEALRKGADIFTDVEMVRTGINKNKLSAFGGHVFCGIADQEVAKKAKAEGITRAMTAMRCFGHRMDDNLVVIGNAPTALFEVLRLVKEEQIHPACIIGIPVGFVGAADAKKALTENARIPFITVEGTKGGSSIAAAAINAILYDMDD